MNFKRLIVATALSGMIAPVFAASPYCIAFDGGFGNGGESIVLRNFDIPDPSKCSPAAGYTKTGATVILQTSGSACLSSDGLVMTLLITTANNNGGNLQLNQDYIQFCPAGASTCPSGVFPVDTGGNIGGSPAPQDCTDDLLFLPSVHD